MNNRSVFRPINEDHAIQSVKFVLAFKNVIVPDAVQNVVNGRGGWAEALPAFGLNDAVVDNGVRKVTLPVANFAFLRPDGSADWTLDVGGNQIAIECFLYTRWERVWQAASTYMRQIAEILAPSQQNLQLGSLELTVRDIFISNSSEYDLGELFKINQEYLGSWVFDAGSAWHCNIGWFEDVDESTKTLNHLNTEATPAVPDNSSWAIGVTHLQQDRLSSPQSIVDIVESEYVGINIAMARLHHKNKELLEKLLHSNMAEKISLVGGRI